MGYRSDFRLASNHADEVKQRILAWLETQNDDLKFYLKNLFEDEYVYESKWYDHTDDMVELSKAFPDEQFIVEVQGEEHDDMWCSYSWHGECRIVHASIVWPKDPFEEEADE